MAHLCRDCLWMGETIGADCPRCHSRRMAAHSELQMLSIAHVDCDAFYASVEKRDDPSLLDKPLLIGGTSGRGVVTTACYVARKFGPRSAMPMFKALKLCPDAVVIPPDMAKYQAVSRQIRALFQEVTDCIEPVSIDEAFLDLDPEHRKCDEAPAVSLARLAGEIEEQVGVTVSVGLSYNKSLAKLASDIEKPRGFSMIGRTEAHAFLRDLPVTKIHGVGAATAERMEQAGWTTIGQLQELPEEELVARFGRFGRRLALYVHGQDDRLVSSSRSTKSISSETTFTVDQSSFEPLAEALDRLAERVAERARTKSMAGRGVTLKLKTSDFQTITRSRQLASPTQRTDQIRLAARHLLGKEIDGRRYRLIGIGLSALGPADDADPPSLFDKLD